MNHIFIAAGEVSGDLHGANLVKKLKEIYPDIKFSGLGGMRMSETGVHIYYDMTKISALGIFEVLIKLPLLGRIFNEMADVLKNQKPDAVILIDYPGFNLRLAKKAKKLNIPVIYYISPQVWAWDKGRIGIIKKYVKKLIVIFKFEEKLYRENGVDASFVGHPLIDVIPSDFNKEAFLSELGLSPSQKIITFLPGSRITEINNHLPAMLGAAELIKEKIPGAQFLLTKSPNLPDDIFKKYIDKSGLYVVKCDGRNYECINASDLVITSSGTATMETAILEKPMVVIYRLFWGTYLLLKNMIKIPDIALVNVVAARRIVPELVQSQATAHNIAEEAVSILSDEKRYASIKKELSRLREALGPPGASERAARIVSEILS